MKYTTVLFDLDGTLTDPAEGITNSIFYALHKWNIEVEDKKSLYKFIGPPLVDSFTRDYGFSREDALLTVDFYREYFSVKGLFENSVYEGIPALLAALKKEGLTVALATSKPEKYAIEILNHFLLDGCFDLVAGASMDESRNRKDQVIAYALSGLKEQDKSRIIMVGDRKHDVLGAKENGLDCIGVLYGYGSKGELEDAGAIAIAQTVNELKDLLLKNE